MALSGSFSATQRNGKETVRCDWVGTQNVASNKTTITAKLYFTNQYAISIGSRTHTITINGTAKTITSGNITTAGEHYIGSVSVDVPHNSDGTKSISMSFVFSLKATLSGTYYESMSSSTTASLNTIPRASTPSFSTSSVVMGSSVTINTNRASSSFTHTLTYTFGSASGTIASNVGTSTTWKPALSLTNQIPKATSGTATIICKTYNGSTLIGTTSKKITLTVPSSVVPSISSITCTDPTNYLSVYGGYVQAKSTVKVSVSASGSYSSTIKSYKIVVNGATYTSNNCTTGVLKTSGTNTISTTVTDSRGRTATKSTTISVIAYTSPIISALSAYRCDSSGTENDEGEYMIITASASISPINNINTKSFTLQYKKSSESTPNVIQVYESEYTYGVSTNAIKIGTDDTIEIKLFVKDDFTNIGGVYNLGTAYTLIDFNASGKGIAFGKVSTEDGFDVNMPALFRQDVTTIEGASLNKVNTNKLDKSAKEWKTLGSAKGTTKIDLTALPSDATDLLISTWTTNSNTNNSRIFQNIIAVNQLVAGNNYDIYNLGAYIFKTSDYGYCSVNINKSYVQIRYYFYGGENRTTSAKIRVRYR